MTLLFVLVTGLWFADNTEFVAAVDQQRKEGFKWHQIECRDRNPALPAIVITTPAGREIVCHKLQ